ncbi:glycoside hydrolase family 36 protein [Maribacter sp. 2210JD10-5]|uniref:glycoside hydrolase family 36 protein n=1 Tax=Maribacter sp. 2210JD10-5 TaxID=3386272 RepID=UPI0039BCC935
MSKTLEIYSDFNVEIVCDDEKVITELHEIYKKNGVSILELKVSPSIHNSLVPVTLKWKIPAINVKGIWKPTSDFNKRIQADWELEHMESRISIDAPVINLFGHKDENVMTFACSNAIDKIEMNASLREEDNHYYCHITFFSEQHFDIKDFKVQLRLDSQENHFSQSLKNVAKWWESFENLKPAHVPAIAKRPFYSTWYQFHQNLDPEILLEECTIAKELGYDAIIIDDGWQTHDTNRGYDYTGDWEPDRIPDMAGFIERIHTKGMKVALWYSVPFCGKMSRAYKKFKGKFLTENHRWAPVFDPRYPEVRSHLINLYTKGLKEWNLDGFKLDFIDDFKWYPDTPEFKEGMDYDSINLAVDRLLMDAQNALYKINPEVFIEFRQKYTGPAMRKYGNMFRAFDCPGDATMNRVRIADIKMLCGDSAPHADMVTWHPDEPVEIAALQLANILFGVPQLSVVLKETPKSYLKMIRFFTQYWNKYSDILLSQDFVPMNPLANYPLQYATLNETRIYGIHSPVLVSLEKAYSEIHFINAQIADEIILKCNEDFGKYSLQIFNCKGEEVDANADFELKKDIVQIAVPPCGIIKMRKI